MLPVELLCSYNASRSMPSGLQTPPSLSITHTTCSNRCIKVPWVQYIHAELAKVNFPLIYPLQPLHQHRQVHGLRYSPQNRSPTGSSLNETAARPTSSKNGLHGYRDRLHTCTATVFPLTPGLRSVLRMISSLFKNSAIAKATLQQGETREEGKRWRWTLAPVQRSMRSYK